MLAVVPRVRAALAKCRNANRDIKVVLEVPEEGAVYLDTPVRGLVVSILLLSIIEKRELKRTSTRCTRFNKHRHR